MPVIRRHAKRRTPEERAQHKARRTAGDGVVLDSILEKEHYEKLRLLVAAKAITELKVHPHWKFEIDGTPYGGYEADFSYREKGGSLRVEDIKAWTQGKKGLLEPIVSPQFIYQKGLMIALFEINVLEV